MKSRGNMKEFIIINFFFMFMVDEANVYEKRKTLFREFLFCSSFLDDEGGDGGAGGGKSFCLFKIYFTVKILQSVEGLLDKIT